MADIWSPAPGTPLVLRLDADSDAVGVRIAWRTVAPARETPLQKFLYSPKYWASTIAGVLVIALFSTAFASGSIRPAPPPAPTARPGEPTATPDTRSAISFGGIQLVAPVMPTAVPPTSTPEPASANPQQLELVTPTAVPPTACGNLFGIGCGAPAPPPAPKPAAPAKPQAPQATQQSGETPPTEGQPPPTDPPPPTPAPCTNFLGIGCPQNQSAPQQPAQNPEQRVLPVASPAALRTTNHPDASPGDTGPQPGTNLDRALRIASIASDQFNRSLQDEAEASASPEPAAPDPQRGPRR